MKSFRSMFRGYAVALAALLMSAVVAEAKSNSAVVRGIRDGSAEWSEGGTGNWKPLRMGQTLKAGSSVKTDANATVDLFLGDNGPVVRVTKGTTLGIDKLDSEDTGIEKVIETQLDLKNGRILGNVKKMAAASKYEVKTPVGVAGIRGTQYAISANGTVQIVEGTVVVVYVIGNQVFPPVTGQAGQTITPPATVNDQPVVGPTTIQLEDMEFTDIIIQPGDEPVVVLVPLTTNPNFDTTNTELTRTGTE